MRTGQSICQPLLSARSFLSRFLRQEMDIGRQKAQKTRIAKGNYPELGNSNPLTENSLMLLKKALQAIYRRIKLKMKRLYAPVYDTSCPY